jgi:tetratricopeptide (TPR) repeat protein
MLIPRLKIVGKLVIATAILSLGFSISVERFSFLPFQSINQAIAQNSLNTRQQKKIALVIGNANYQVGKLDTPLNDATDMAAALKELGFEVILIKDSSKRKMNDALDQFSTRIKKGYVGLFYYAGHGMQLEGENYLIPVNAQIKAEKDVEYESMPLGKILGRMESAGNRINIVILDACRDNPFRKFSRSSNRGLTTPVQTASGTLIVFATAPGKVASDGIGSNRNGLFTSYLLKYIKTPNKDVETILRYVRTNVAKDTKNYQVPWNSSSLTGEFAFNQKSGTTTSPSVISPPIPKPRPTQVTPKPQPSPSPQLTAKTFNNRGISKKKLGDYQGAIADYNQAIKLKPDYAEAYTNRGIAKYNLGISKYSMEYLQGAIWDYDKALKLKPDDAEAYYNRGLSYKYFGYSPNAINDFLQAKKLYQQQNNQTGYQASLDRLKELGVSN